MATGEVISSIKGNKAKVAGQEPNVYTSMPAILDFLQRAHDYVYNGDEGNHFKRKRNIKHVQYPGDDDLYDTDDDTEKTGEHFNRSPAYWQPPEFYGTSNIIIRFLSTAKLFEISTEHYI